MLGCSRGSGGVCQADPTPCSQLRPPPYPIPPAAPSPSPPPSHLVFSSACAMLHCVTFMRWLISVATRFPSLRARGDGGVGRGG